MGMDLINCKKCGRAFMKDGNDFCRRCRSDTEDEYRIVKQYVYDNPGATILEVHEATGVAEKLILQYLREGRLEITDDTNFVLDCQRCGTSIKSGKYCENCTHEMAKEFQSAMKPVKREEKKPDAAKKSQRMHVDVKRER